jgi:hypothetical protein
MGCGLQLLDTAEQVPEFKSKNRTYHFTILPPREFFARKLTGFFLR